LGNYCIPYCIIIHQTQPKFNYLNLPFRPQSEAFIRRSWYSVLAVLDTSGRWSVKKAVIGVTELIAELIHSMLAFLADQLVQSDGNRQGAGAIFQVDNKEGYELG